MSVLKALVIGFGITVWIVLGIWASAAVDQRDDMKSFYACLCLLAWIGLTASALVYEAIR